MEKMIQNTVTNSFFFFLINLSFAKPFIAHTHTHTHKIVYNTRLTSENEQNQSNFNIQITPKFGRHYICNL